MDEGVIDAFPGIKLPIVYSDHYNIGFMGLEKLHPFDSRKWGNVFKRLHDRGILSSDSVHEAREAETEELLKIHTAAYLADLKSSITLAKFVELPVLAALPQFLLDEHLLKPMRFQTAGSKLGAELALSHGWSVNIGGGFHHASRESGGGFCIYADVTLAVQRFLDSQDVEKVLIVDLDAHQGNGHERDFKNEKRVYILDAFNSAIYPNDMEAKKRIDRKVELDSYTEDQEYLDQVNFHLDCAINSINPDAVVYIAGTDILDGDRLGRLSITPTGVVRRDDLVFTKCLQRSRPIPILMLLGGGYTSASASVVAESIQNLISKFRN